MTLEVSLEEQTGKPPRPGVYVVAFEDAPLRETMSYWDGFNWGHGAADVLGAMQGLRKNARLPFYKRRWRVKVKHWRSITVAKVSLVEVLSAALGG